jgi:hypothetical protein
LANYITCKTSSFALRDAQSEIFPGSIGNFLQSVLKYQQPMRCQEIFRIFSTGTLTLVAGSCNFGVSSLLDHIWLLGSAGFTKLLHWNPL